MMDGIYIKRIHYSHIKCNLVTVIAQTILDNLNY